VIAYVFLLGRPGCGKSAVYRLLGERIKQEGLADGIERLDDFPILDELLAEDKEFKRHVRKEGGFEITDFSILDDVLKRMNERLKELKKPGKLIFVEFSRDSYDHALKNFDREVLDSSLLLYIYCPFDLCLKRNVERFKRRREAVDNHIVPTDLMRSYYKHDDYEELHLRSGEELRRRAPAELAVVRNDAEEFESLKGELEKVMDAINKE
jgi:adenylate kinase family enzyme